MMILMMIRSTVVRGLMTLMMVADIGRRRMMIRMMMISTVVRDLEAGRGDIAECFEKLGIIF